MLKLPHYSVVQWIVYWRWIDLEMTNGATFVIYSVHAFCTLHWRVLTDLSSDILYFVDSCCVDTFYRQNLLSLDILNCQMSFCELQNSLQLPNRNMKILLVSLSVMMNFVDDTFILFWGEWGKRDIFSSDLFWTFFCNPFISQCSNFSYSFL